MADPHNNSGGPATPRDGWLRGRIGALLQRAAQRGRGGPAGRLRLAHSAAAAAAAAAAGFGCREPVAARIKKTSRASTRWPKMAGHTGAHRRHRRQGPTPARAPVQRSCQAQPDPGHTYTYMPGRLMMRLSLWARRRASAHSRAGQPGHQALKSRRTSRGAPYNTGPRSRLGCWPAGGPARSLGCNAKQQARRACTAHVVGRQTNGFNLSCGPSRTPVHACARAH
jgi:hypothetical protein